MRFDLSSQHPAFDKLPVAVEETVCGCLGRCAGFFENQLAGFGDWELGERFGFIRLKQGPQAEDCEYRGFDGRGAIHSGMSRGVG
jgi:hypothetical protein